MNKDEIIVNRRASMALKKANTILRRLRNQQQQHPTPCKSRRYQTSPSEQREMNKQWRIEYRNAIRDVEQLKRNLYRPHHQTVTRATNSNIIAFLSTYPVLMDRGADIFRFVVMSWIM